jgi:hypothetical protein
MEDWNTEILGLREEITCLNGLKSLNPSFHYSK